jgi:hypothetical protein
VTAKRLSRNAAEKTRLLVPVEMVDEPVVLELCGFGIGRERELIAPAEFEARLPHGVAVRRYMGGERRTDVKSKWSHNGVLRYATLDLRHPYITIGLGGFGG